MAKQLKVYINDDNDPAVNCPRCDELIVPFKSPLGLDGYDCPECSQVIQSSQLRAYRKSLKDLEDGVE